MVVTVADGGPADPPPTTSLAYRSQPALTVLVAALLGSSRGVPAKRAVMRSVRGERRTPRPLTL